MEAIHNLIHEAAHKLATGNIEGAKTLLSAIDELTHDAIGEKKDSLRLPSQWAFGDRVKLVFNESGVINNAEIVKIHFTASKVFYDVDVIFHYAKPTEEGQPTEYHNSEEYEGHTRLYNVDSAFVQPAA
jgi:hypothetical protein